MRFERILSALAAFPSGGASDTKADGAQKGNNSRKTAVQTLHDFCRPFVPKLAWARAFSAAPSGYVTNGRLLKDLAHAVREVAEGQVARTRESAFPHLDVNRTSMDAHAQPSRIPANSHQLNGGDGR
jgi:hypothetical protein